MSSPRVDFAYSFATPHRLTVALPDSSDKTLLDLSVGSLTVSWTYDDLTTFPLATNRGPLTSRSVRIQPEIDGSPFARSTWTRSEGFLPSLDNEYFDGRGRVVLQAVGGQTAQVTRVEFTNTGDVPHLFGLPCALPHGFGCGYNPSYVGRGTDPDTLLAGWGDRADRILMLVLGADKYDVHSSAIRPTWLVDPGEAKVGWVVRPYSAYHKDLSALREHDWASEMEAGKEVWRSLLGRATDLRIPDAEVRNAFYACLGDLFIMREPVADGYIAACPGTEGYRAANSIEPGVVAVALDQVGLHDESEIGYRMCLHQQGEDGDWADPRGWVHLFWSGPGFKSWAVIEHYLLTGDREYLADVYPRMLASSRFQESMRADTRIMDGPERSVNYGLMPRGQGDCGLKDGEDDYGVFFPHNIWSVYADKITLQAARILGRAEDVPELRAIYETALEDLIRALDRGAIPDDGGYRWIPGASGSPSGSRWGVLNALSPCELLPVDHELITGTIRYMESHLSPGGMPVHTGWMPDGMWVAITLDNLAEAHLARGNGEAAAEYLYGVLNHGTPLYTWCEERGTEPGTSRISGDRQHLWTPVAVVRAIRDSLVMESGDGLSLALGVPQGWWASGESIGISDAPTHFGAICYEAVYDASTGRLRGTISFPGDSTPAWVRLHVHLPGGLRVASVTCDAAAEPSSDGKLIEWRSPSGTAGFTAQVS